MTTMRFGALGGREAVRDEDRRTALEESIEGPLDDRLALQVERGRRLVQDQHAGSREEGPRQRELLTFAGRQRLAALVHRGVESLGQAVHQVAQPDDVDRGVDVVLGRVGMAEAQVGADGARRRGRALGARRRAVSAASAG